MHEVVVVVEVPRGGRVKRAADGSIDYVSPLACPFNYGSAPDLPSADGEPHDAIVLGPALALGHRGTWPVHGVVRFVDEDLRDDKLICGEAPPTDAETREIRTFFRRYACLKGLLARARGRGRVRFEGLAPWP